MRRLSFLSLMVLIAGLLGCLPNAYADDTDRPHVTHSTADRGPLITDCNVCHIGTPADDNVYYTSCEDCHSPAGIYDGVNDPVIGAANNWHNIGGAGADFSMIYEEDGTLKKGKEKWCAGCHDENPTEEIILIDDFESYTDDASLQANWKRVRDAKLPKLEPLSTGKIAPEGLQCLRARIKWTKTAEDEGIVKRLYDPPLDLTEADTVNFYIRVSNPAKMTKIIVRIKKYPEGTWSKVEILPSELESNVFKFFTFKREHFTDPSFGFIDAIQFRYMEASPSSTWAQDLLIDHVYFSNSIPAPGGPNVVGDNTSYGYYVTGHRMSCTRCHDSTTGHLDGEDIPALEYIKTTPHPNGFRLYDNDPEKYLRLPYNYYNTSNYNAADFALCYQCHFETNLIGDAWGDGTNFVDQSPNRCGLPPNLHYLHLYTFADDQWPTSCVHCHTPMGQYINPVMTRPEMGDSIVFDTDGCVITDVQDRRDSAINQGFALQSTTVDIIDVLSTCESCHDPSDVTPPNDPCDPGAANPYDYTSCLSDGFYVRDYEYRPHTGDPDDSCMEPDCHGDVSHIVHLNGVPRGPDPMDCEDCHTASLPELITGSCDDCHSPDGAFDGVNDTAIGALHTWDEGVYEEDGQLKSANKNWCLGCHDDNPNTIGIDESAYINGTHAPNIAGDQNNGDTYGFNISGCHRNSLIKCTTCHRINRNHIDGEPRTYEVADDGTISQSVVTPYVESYRLPDGSITVPSPVGSPFVVEDYALCFSCHNSQEVFGENLNQWDISHTNFWDSMSTLSYIGNAHTYHVKNGSVRSDTDWDGLPDSRMLCIDCHNIHGSFTKAQIRHGELISTPGTTDKVPALDFTYLVPATGPAATATFTATTLTGGDYNVYAWWTSHSNRAQDATYMVYHDGAGSPSPVTKDQRTGGGAWQLLGTFTYNTPSSGTVVLDNDFSAGRWLIADAVRWDKVGGGDEVIVDNVDATFVNDHNTWYTSTNFDPYHGNLRYIAAHSLPAADPTATLAESEGGFMLGGWGYISNNYVCNTCHSEEIHGRYIRTPNLWPQVFNFPGAIPDTVDNESATTSNITVIVKDPDDNVSTVTIDLSAFGGSTTQGMTNNFDGTWSHALNIPADTPEDIYPFEITATDENDNTGTASGTITVIDPDDVVYDDADAVFDPACEEPCDPLLEWTPSSPGQAYGGQSLYKIKGDGSGTATWTFTVPTSGNYRVYAWWVAAGGKYRSQNVPYTIHHRYGPSTVNVDQTDSGPGGGKWNLLGTYEFLESTTYSVMISDNATPAPISGGNTWVIADAIKLDPEP